jgi:hypothetical protein
LATNQGENESTHIPGEQIREEILNFTPKKMVDSLVLSLLFWGPFFKPNFL